MQDFLSPDIEADLARLEAGIRQAKIQYDMFFAGALPKQPLELRVELERLIKRYTTAPIRKYAVRFHFNSLVSRYNSLSELWSKTLRTIEEGDRPAPAVSDRTASVDQTLAKCKLRNPIQEQELLKSLHARFLEARRKAGDHSDKLTFESFVRGVASQTERLRSKAACEEVELRLVVRDRKVHLRARPCR